MDNSLRELRLFHVHKKEPIEYIRQFICVKSSAAYLNLEMCRKIFCLYACDEMSSNIYTRKLTNQTWPRSFQSILGQRED